MRGINIVADLHIHTSASDGLNSPEEVVAMAAGLGLCAIAITDHDSVDGLPGAISEADRKNIRLIPGIELSTVQGKQEIHVLGYGLDFENRQLRKMLETLKNSRVQRAEKMVRRLRELGYNMDMSDVAALSGDSAPGRPHIARALIAKGYIDTVQAAFRELLGPGKAAYVERYKLTAAEAIAAIHRAGGIAVWAHPELTGDSAAVNYALVRAGIDGYEAFHPDLEKWQTETCLKMARGKSLCITGGSDFHGEQAGTKKQLAACGLTEPRFAAFYAYLQKKAVFS